MPLSARMQKKQWVIRKRDERCDGLARSLKVSTLVAQVLINRGVTDPQSGALFLHPRLTELIGPEQMPGVKAAVKRIRRAVEEKEKITIYGDYDVDGITAVTILWRLLRLLGAEVDYYIPHRIDEGYGLNPEAVRSLTESGSKLLITVDCGVTAFDAALLAEQSGLDVIITDHHRLESDLPRAVAVVHPAIESDYPNQDAAGAMVAFKLAWALANEFNQGSRLEPALREFMLNATSLAAMGTVADVMDLRGENRILTSYGLKALPDCRLSGVQALVESAGLTGRGLDSFHVGFRLAPMLNAAGRMGHARLAVELLTSDSDIRSTQIAQYLKEQNSKRQQFERKIFKQACEMIVARGLNHPDHRSIVLADKNWHGGVIGIVASRIVDKFCRPTVMINTADTESGFAQGSARSVPGFGLLGAIKTCSRHLNSFGGHEMAAGLTIEPDKIPDFAADFEKHARENLSRADIVTRLNIDAEAPLSEFNMATVTELRMLEPFGQGNPEPLFATKGVRLASQPRKVGAAGDHLQLAITDGTATVRCIGFRFGKLEKKLLDHECFNVAYRPHVNTYNGSSSAEFILTDVQFE